MPFLIGKGFSRSVTSRTSGRGSGMAGPVNLVAAPAGGPMAGPLVLVGRKFAPALLDRELAAWREGTAGRQVGQRGPDALDLLQPPLRHAAAAAAHEFKSRDRGHQPVRVGMQR